MSCPRCQHLHSRIAIRIPSDLTKVIRVVQSNLNDGTLEEVDRNPLLSPAPFRGIGDEGPWEDIVAHEFRCRTCDARFHLLAETYHGAGGEWAPSLGAEGVKH